MKDLKPRAVSYSTTTITELMIPSYANFGGKIHGGLILSLMDKVAYACAAKHAGGYCVTVSMNGVDFLAPVEVGDLVSLIASVNYVGISSMVIGIKVVSENVVTGEQRHTNSSYLTMVAKDDEGKPRPVPHLKLETKKQVRRFMEAKKRRDFIKNLRENLEANKLKEDEAIAHLNDLTNERCVIDLI
jgi:acyl-CoA hydrolase